MRQYLLGWLLGVGLLAQAGPPDAPVKPRREFPYGAAQAVNATFSHDGRLVIVSNSRSRIGVFQGRTALLVNEFRKHKQSVTALASWAGRDTIVSADASGLVVGWRPRSGQVVGQVQLPGPVSALCPQPAGSLVALLAKAGVWLVDLGAGTKQVLPAAEARQTPTSLRFDATGNQLAIGYADGSVVVRNVKARTSTTAKLFKTPIRDLLFRGDSLLAVAGTPAVGYWRFGSAEPARTTPVSRPVWCLAQRVSGAGNRLFLGLATGEIIDYTLTDQQETKVGQTKALVQHLYINPRERLILASYRQATPKTWLLD